MRFLAPYVTESEEGFSFTRLQASRFAKEIADDYNPIHDVNAKRFCVPGDLLFAYLLAQKGLYPRMHVEFSGMVGEGVPLHIDDSEPGVWRIEDAKGKEYLQAEYEGRPTSDEELVEEFIRGYVRFSGHNFPHILRPLMAAHGVMINVDRPLVIYESMGVDLAKEKMHVPELEYVGADLEVVGKRGNATLKFRFMEDGEQVGTGVKKMVLSGLREYEEAMMNHMVDLYDQRKRDRVE